MGRTQNYKSVSERFFCIFCSAPDFQKKAQICSKMAKIGIVVAFQQLARFQNKTHQQNLMEKSKKNFPFTVSS